MTKDQKATLGTAAAGASVATFLLAGAGWVFGFVGIRTIGPAASVAAVAAHDSVERQALALEVMHDRIHADKALADHRALDEERHTEFLAKIEAVRALVEKMERRQELMFYAQCVDLRERTPARVPPTCGEVRP